MTKPVSALLAIAALSACAREGTHGNEQSAVEPNELWLCDHVESQYSGYVVSETITSEEWAAIEFVVYDNDQFHTLEMFYHGSDLWRVEANLLELDCNSDDLGGDFIYWQ